MVQFQFRLSILGSISVGLLIATNLAAQSSDAVPPEPFYALRSGGALTPLTEVTAVLRGEGKLLWLGGSRVSWVISGSKAPIRLKAADAPVFISGPRGMQLVRLEVIHGRREWVYSETTLSPPGFAVTSSFRSDVRGIPLRLTRKDSHQWKIEPQVPLAPGDYAFVAFEQQPKPGECVFYLFAVDAPSGSAAATGIQAARGSAPGEERTNCILFWCRHQNIHPSPPNSIATDR